MKKFSSFREFNLPLEESVRRDLFINLLTAACDVWSHFRCVVDTNFLRSKLVKLVSDLANAISAMRAGLCGARTLVPFMTSTCFSSHRNTMWIWGFKTQHVPVTKPTPTTTSIPTCPSLKSIPIDPVLKALTLCSNATETHRSVFYCQHAD